MTIDDCIDRRNKIQHAAECIDDDLAVQCWSNLGVANRHINRVLEGALELSPAVEREITDCLDRVEAAVITGAKK